jgi:hypothetical protein
MPDNMRMVEPELPQSSGAEGAFRHASLPSISPEAPVRLTVQPSASTHPKVLEQSAAVEKFNSFVVPLAIAAIMA